MHVCPDILFVWFDSLCPINNLLVIKRRVLLGWTSTKLGLMFLLKDTTQWRRWGSNPKHFIHAYPDILFVWFDSLCPINNLLVIKRRVLLGWTSTKLGLMFLLKDTTQWRRWGWNPKHFIHAYPDILLVWFDSLCPINNLLVIKRRALLGWTSTKLGLMFLLKDTTQWRRWGSNPKHFIHAYPDILLVWFDSLCPINNLLVIKRWVLLGWTSTKLGLMFVLKDTTQWRRWGSNPQPLGLESSTLKLSNCAPVCLDMADRQNMCKTDYHFLSISSNRGDGQGGRRYGDGGCGIGGRGCGIGGRGAGKRELRGREEGQLWAGVWKDWRAKLLFFPRKFIKNDS